MHNPILEFNQVHFEYRQQEKPSVPILKGLNLAIDDGEFVSVVGPSGSGKTTLFRLITGLEQPTEGSIFLNGTKEDQRLGKVGYMPQQDLLMPWRTILDNATLPLELKGVNRERAHQQASELLTEFGLADTKNRYPGDLSGGMRQRVSFLRSILSGSNILLLDEPFSALDAITRLTMQEWLLEQWKKWKKTILFITHDVDEALFLSDRILVFTGRPVSTMQEWNVPLGRPRTIRDLSQGKIVSMKEQLIDQLRVKMI